MPATVDNAEPQSRCSVWVFRPGTKLTNWYSRRSANGQQQQSRTSTQYVVIKSSYNSLVVYFWNFPSSICDSNQKKKKISKTEEKVQTLKACAGRLQAIRKHLAYVKYLIFFWFYFSMVLVCVEFSCYCVHQRLLFIVLWEFFLFTLCQTKQFVINKFFPFATLMFLIYSAYLIPIVPIGTAL